MLNTVDKVLKIANDEVGYLEKASPSNLYSKEKNVGSANWTKYGLEMSVLAPSIYPKGGTTAYWCDTFVDWLFVKAFGEDEAKKLLGGWSAYTPTSAQKYKDMKQWFKSPQVGDQIFFKNSERICHTGIVYQVDSKYVYTIEGNTSSSSGVIRNGGCVAKKKYLLTYNKIEGYGRPKYDKPSKIEVETKVVKTFDGSEIVRKCQVWLNTFSCNNIKEDGFYGTETKVAIIKVLQTILREDYKKGLVKVNGKFDLTTKNNIVSCKLKTYGRLVKLIECYLFCTGYNPQDFNGNYIETVANAVYEYQEKNKLDKDKIWGKQCWATALK